MLHPVTRHAYALLPLFYTWPGRTYYAHDLLMWRGHAFNNCTAEFRLYWLHAKLAEEGGTLMGHPGYAGAAATTAGAPGKGSEGGALGREQVGGCSRESRGAGGWSSGWAFWSCRGSGSFFRFARSQSYISCSPPSSAPCSRAIQYPRVGARLRSRDSALQQPSNSLHSRDALNSICPYLPYAGQEVEMVDGAAAPASALANGAASVGGVGGVADGAGQASGSWTAVYVQMKDAETDTDYQ